MSAAMPSPAAATCRSAAAPASRRNTASRIRRICCSSDLTDWSVVEPNGFPRLPLQRPRDHPRLRRQQRRRPSNGCSRTASSSSTRRPTRIGGNAVGNSVPREMHCRRRWTGRWCRPASRPIRTMQATTSSGNGLMRPLEAAAAQGRRRDPARAPHDRDPSRDAERRPRHRHRRRPQRHEPQHPRPQGRDHRHRRLDRQRQFPPHVRSAPDRGILRARRHAVVRPGRQRRDRRHGDRRLAVGPVQPDRRVRLQHHQAGRDRLPVRLRQSALDAGQPRCSTRRAPSGCG